MVERKTLQRVINNNYLLSEYLGDYSKYLFTNGPNLGYSWVKKLCANSLEYTVGDPLSCAISQSFDNNSEFALQKILEIYSNSNIIEGIVLRQIKESDYYDFLNGQKPISKFNGEDFFLMKDDSDSGYEYKIARR